ncbi:MAG: P-II family nitrogen regulator [Eubacteriales bacterium]
MKKIEAIVRPSKFEDVKEELSKINVNGVTISQVMGCGRQKGWKEVYRGTVIELHMLPKIKMELVVKDEDLDKVLNVIMSAAKCDDVGDGKIFVYDVANAIRIRTGERGDDAV